MNYWERHIGDYIRDTAHLSMVEHGAYTLLLDRYYATESAIPAAHVHRLARARTREERAAVDAVLAEFFYLEDGHWHHGRAEFEIQQAALRIEIARENGKKGGRPRKTKETHQKPSGLSLGYENETQGKPKHNPIESSPDTRHQTPDTRHQLLNTTANAVVVGDHGQQEGLTSEKPLVSGKPEPPVPHQKIISAYNTILGDLGLPRVRPELWNGKRNANLRARWRELPERQSVDWWRRYFQYVAGLPFLTGNKGNFRADLEWLVNQNNMAKVCEGKYE